MDKYSLTLEEASAYTGLGVWALKNAINHERLKACKPTGNKCNRVLIRKADLEEFVDKGERK